jgi:anti-sigma factor RsiW
LADVAPMPCQELVELVTSYLDRSLDGADRERLEAHLKLCDPCVAFIEQFRETIAASGHLHAGDLAPDTQAELLKLFKDWRTA